MAPITERYLQDQVRKQCADLGLTVQHMEDSRRSWVPGWPDLTIIGPRGILWRELKTQEGRLTPDQRRVAASIITAGGNFEMWKPRDLLYGRIARELTAISRIGATNADPPGPPAASLTTNHGHQAESPTTPEAPMPVALQAARNGTANTTATQSADATYPANAEAARYALAATAATATRTDTMARLPSEEYLIQQIGDNVILFQDHTELEIVRYPVSDKHATAAAQKVIADSKLNPEDKSFAHFWCGYFYAHACHQ